MTDLPNTPKIGAGVIAIDTRTGDILLGRRGFNGNSPNTWAPFGGTFELKDGNPKETAKREFKEESGYDGSFQISSGPIYVNKNNNLTFFNYIGLFDGKFPVKIDYSESLGYGWFPLNSLPENLLKGFQELIDSKGGEIQKMIDDLTKNKENVNIES
jgi:8-oxo-dGTP pyrophosphatase MutT (NUDIX family)